MFHCNDGFLGFSLQGENLIRNSIFSHSEPATYYNTCIIWYNLTWFIHLLFEIYMGMVRDLCATFWSIFVARYGEFNINWSWIIQFCNLLREATSPAFLFICDGLWLQLPVIDGPTWLQVSPWATMIKMVLSKAVPSNVCMGNQLSAGNIQVLMEFLTVPWHWHFYISHLNFSQPHGRVLDYVLTKLCCGW